MTTQTRRLDNNPTFGVEQHGFDFIPESRAQHEDARPCV